MKHGQLLGGQAVLEGVMMRGSSSISVAVRQPDGDIAVIEQPINYWTTRTRLRKWPFVRGVFVLIEALLLGITGITLSAKYALPEEEELGKGEMGLAVFGGLALAVLLFFLIPTYAVNYLAGGSAAPVVRNVVEGVLRLAIFLVYLVVVSLLRDMQRLFAYHGAEHKTIHCYEAKRPLKPGEALQFSRLHPRCGTSFLLLVMIISIAVFSLLGWPSLVVRLLSRILLLPVIAGISYEINRLAGISRSPLIKALVYPGLALQCLTTREPTEEQLEVAIKALEPLLEKQDVI